MQDGIVSFDKKDFSYLQYDELGRVLIDSVYEFTEYDRESLINVLIKMLRGKDMDSLDKKSIVDCCAINFAFSHPDFNQWHKKYYDQLSAVSDDLLQMEYCSINSAQFAAFDKMMREKNICVDLTQDLCILAAENEPVLVQIIEHFQRKILQKMIKGYNACMQNINKPRSLVLFSKDLQQAVAQVHTPQQSLQYENVNNLSSSASFKCS